MTLIRSTLQPGLMHPLAALVAAAQVLSLFAIPTRVHDSEHLHPQVGASVAWIDAATAEGVRVAVERGVHPVLTIGSPALVAFPRLGRHTTYDSPRLHAVDARHTCLERFCRLTI